METKAIPMNAVIANAEMIERCDIWVSWRERGGGDPLQIEAGFDGIEAIDPDIRGIVELAASP